MICGPGCRHNTSANFKLLYTLNLSSMQALLTLFVWGYVHFTYIVNSEDCLVNVTERPFPQDVILQVEVYSNTTELWHEREGALHAMYKKMYNRSHVPSESSTYLNTGWIKSYCETSLLINLTGTRYFCQWILSELFQSVGNNKYDGPMKETAAEPHQSTCARVDFFDLINASPVVNEMSAFYSSNYTLYDLFDHYGKDLCMISCARI